MKADKQIIGLAAEFAVASELCKRNIYAQLTLGMRKRTDILVETENSMLRIQVKAKQGKTWPNCKGVYGDNIVLVFVDFANITEDERPDFYILTSEDWKNLIENKLETRISIGEVVINEKNIPIWPQQMSKGGKPYEGMGVKSEYIEEFKEQWDKIKNIL